MKKILATLLATASIAVTSAIAQPLSFNISEYDLALEYTFNATCIANGDIVVKSGSEIGKVDSFSITSSDFIVKGQAIYFVADIDGPVPIVALVIADKSTGDIDGLLSLVDPILFEEAINNVGDAIAARLVLSENFFFVQAFLNTSFPLELGDFEFVLRTNLELRSRGEADDTRYNPPTLKLFSYELHGEGSDSLGPQGPEDTFIVQTGSMSATGNLAFLDGLLIGPDFGGDLN